MNKMGEELITVLNENFSLEIKNTSANQKKMANIIDEIVENWEYGYCPNCEERIGEPMRDESRD